ncbi:ADP-ribosylglycohydrolase family protein [Cohnella hashimotonis]|uniref:ADP-ribosylglycohydrolase family protein n=1 Tax=Cohnella hashimotonis TaxID=2826895 RepID=A0ABT6TG28_9BACL|nr:ADP-ribosylglycohydrolase family protein [Cohnella hashimotonis]MDI4645799.1 ADP-ribosylglycohydrolase family protein [Cohnella hashimotonis]
MASKTINAQDYYRRVYGGWLGKNIGGTLGAPVEGSKELLNLTFYPKLPDGPLENDDLDLQLVWLHALEQYGARLTAIELGQEWVEHVFFPFDEYGYALTNLRRGLTAPVAGWFNNPFTHCMGSPIRSEIWAMVAPGAPHVAAYYAYQDAIVDHAGGEGVYGEMFFASIESAIFIETDRDRLISIGLQHIPSTCRTAKAIHDLLRWHKEGKDWLEARLLILEHHGSSNFTDAPQNIAFTILGWLYGTDFEDCLLKAVNCGYDTDCTAATLGAILGMILGPELLPERWVNPVGDRIVVSPQVKGFPAPATLEELTHRTMLAGREVLATWGAGVEIRADACTSNDNHYNFLEVPKTVTDLWNTPFTANRYLLPQGTRTNRLSLELTIDFGMDGPSIGRGGTKQLSLTLVNHSREAWNGNLDWQLPDGWSGSGTRPFTLAPGGVLTWTDTIHAPEVISVTNEIALIIHRIHDNAQWSKETVNFTLLAASRWQISGPNQSVFQTVDFAGDRIDFNSALNTTMPGKYTAVSKLVNPHEQAIRLIAGTANPVKVWLNGTILFEDDEETEFMPAYHRSPRSKMQELRLAAGTHDIRIEIMKDEKPLELFILPILAENLSKIGEFFYLIEIYFDANAPSVLP